MWLPSRRLSREKREMAARFAHVLPGLAPVLALTGKGSRYYKDAEIN
jgi:hypothetical protein